ncbi:MAG: class I SAM-dependent methyltransferase [Acidobacteriota bacterium]|nr:class I SAM-dependent methyltransferase [Acidobacteriota bacterium]
MVVCRNCGTLYTGTLPSLASAQDYDAYYTSANLSDPEFIHQRLDEIVARFSLHRQSNRMLDIGFGAGSLLKAAARAGWEAEGLEVSRTAVNQARADGFNAFCGELSEACYPSGYFDVVTTSELLEHVPEPRLLAAEISRIVRPGGLWWATTPHAKGASGLLLGLKWSVVSPPEHLHLFSVTGLKSLLLNSEFRRARIETEGVNPFELLRMAPWRKNGVLAGAASSNPKGFDRVRTGYQINAAFSSTAPRRMLKGFANGLLRLSRLGDSLKIWAER